MQRLTTFYDEMTLLVVEWKSAQFHPAKHGRFQPKYHNIFIRNMIFDDDVHSMYYVLHWSEFKTNFNNTICFPY